MRPMRLKTLEELEGFVAGEPPFDSSIVRRIYALRKKPIGEFTADDLRFAIGQGRGVPYLLPLALELLETNPLVAGICYHGDLLMAVLRAVPQWASRAVHLQVRGLVERALAQLSAIEPIDWSADKYPDPDQPDAVDRESLEPRLRDALFKLSEQQANGRWS
jgi:hypothetical protein